ncbi:3-hydroxyacyl-CoA dehydrogenase/enoyl-CoA hydratase family protein [Uliginosibacterium sp. 31-16]|uniref:3-hydroxyacyl-CoA dehydrogenase/enoyl-CoA hydratase family protein n=1 Tax=Uliginosibacterium sp. 31-16 TaxID=3068315 RepID=UPI00273F438E|nr:3-hydroxyacyl-CoA dehydrogenase/enoyl-CoA hydratase family protein [Uliginosibacterium sp. 31-16]MDP5238502.1 3-hydroxyacyl-CoA dehydrogenase/enoyl-CoA hydratase family protein [Uliginosibacterium sp. 31-16]
MSNFIVRKVAVLGAGVMGAQIAAHCANAEVPVLLFDLSTKDGDPSGIARKAIDSLKKIEPSPIATADRVNHIEAANYDQHLDKLAECDLIIEAIAEKMEWKLDLYRKVAPCLRSDAIFATNTSGLSINKLAEGCPASLRPRFCGVHFFNPPRYMSLVELIPCHGTDATLLDHLESFLTSTLGKSVIRALDTPNFVANRVGVFSMLAVMHHTHQFKLGFDEVDALTGPIIGRPKSATYRTADVVGLDTLVHVIQTMADNLADDPWAHYYASPGWLTALIGQGALGQKTKGGIYRKEGKQIKVLDLSTQAYRDSNAEVADEVAALLKHKSAAERFALLRANQHPHAQFLWAVFRDVFHYVAVHLAHIAHNARDIDLAMRWGFGWNDGPFETWQAAGWKEIADAIHEDIRAGRAMSSAPLPPWVFEVSGVHGAHASFDAATGTLKGRSTLPVYQRQLFPERVAGEQENPGRTLWENDEVRMWTLDDDDGRHVPVLSFKSKMCAVGPVVLDGIIEAVHRAEREHAGLVIWQPTTPFCVGANLKQIRPLLEAGDFVGLEGIVAKFQLMSQTLKYAQVPVVAAVNGLALGGGCEIVMHATRAVCALESYIGLVEVGVGLIPAGGGCKEFAIRSAEMAARTATNDPMNWLQGIFQTIAMGSVSKSARNAKELGLLREQDIVIHNPKELLHVARKTALSLAASGYRPRLPPAGVPVAGRGGIATLEMMLVNMREGGMISAHDYLVSKSVATALCGGNVESGTLVNEKWLLDVERSLFVDLLHTAETKARLIHMLEVGKPLRN